MFLLGNKRTFKSGGIHPKENKIYSKDRPIENFHLPQKVIIPLSQHLGAPARILVKKGDMVSEGQLIGEKNGKFSANIHSSIPGKVSDTGNYYTAFNIKMPSVVITLEGDLKKGNDNKEEWENLGKEEIIKRITDAGIVGLGGATFPADIKLDVPTGKKIEYLIINGAECEPFLTCDYRLMMEKAAEIIEAIRIVQKVLDVKNVFIGIEVNKKSAVKLFTELLKGTAVKVVPLKVRYPQGGERQLIQAVIRREVPSGGLPFDIGALVSNVATLYAVREAVIYRKPLTERVVTITGKIVKKPGNYKIKIGTLVNDIISEVGLTEEPGKIIFGGPMMGLSVTSLETPVTKGTSGIIFFSKKEAGKIKYDEYRSCIRCTKCLMVCPASLNPSLLSIHGEFERYDDMLVNNINDCMECGCCTYICPAYRPIVQFIKLGKLMLRNKKNQQ